MFVTFCFDSLIPFVIPEEAQWYLTKIWYFWNLLPESGVRNGKKKQYAAVFLHDQKTVNFGGNLYKLVHAIGLNDVESFHAGYSDYESVQKNVERGLSQQIVGNSSLFVTIFDCFGPSFEAAK